MKVKIAAQTISESVASAIDFARLDSRDFRIQGGSNMLYCWICGEADNEKN